MDSPWTRKGKSSVRVNRASLIFRLGARRSGGKGNQRGGGYGGNGSLGTSKEPSDEGRNWGSGVGAANLQVVCCSDMR